MEAPADRCLALVLKGGANKGSYEAGAIYTLVRNLPAKEVQYQVVSGISVGALNAAHVASYPVGEELNMSEELINLWTNMRTENLYKKWNWGIMEGLFEHQGLYDSSPLYEFVQDYFKNRTLHRLIHINSVDAITGDVVTFDENDWKEDFLLGLCGSAAVPFVFPPVVYKDKLLMDGGVAWSLDISSAIARCREIVDSDSKIVLDIIDLDKNLAGVPPSWNETGNSLSNFMRFRKIRDYYQSADNEFEAQWAFPDVQFRYVISPRVTLDYTYQELSFEPKLIHKLINMGMDDALAAIQEFDSK